MSMAITMGQSSYNTGLRDHANFQILLVSYMHTELYAHMYMLYF